MRLHVLEHGYIDAVEEPFLTEDGAEELVTTRWVDRCFLIDHPAGRLLWDTGLPESRCPLTFGDTKMVVTNPLVHLLSSCGVGFEDIEYLGFSHMHVDHAGNANMLAGSTILINALEHTYAFGPEASGVYFPDDYSDLRDSRTVLIEDQYDVFGDGTVVIHAAPGHTVGHQVLLLQAPDHRPLILAGDVYYDNMDRVHRRAPEWNADQAESFRSMDRIEGLATALDAQLLVHHAAEIPDV